MGFKRALAILWIGSIGLLGLGACTRGESETSKVSFNLPSPSLKSKVGALGNEHIAMIILRVTGSGMNSQRYYWSLHEECDKINCGPGVSLPTPPSSVSLEISKGERLFQVVLVIENDSGQIQFNYGDTLQKLVSDTEAVKVQLESLGSAGTEGKVAGRYMTTSTTGPSGSLTMLLAPPNRPAMEIQNTEMVNGWFHAMFFENVKVTYVLKETGEVIFNQKTLADISGQATAATNHLKKISLPAFYRQNSDGCEKESATTLVLGFFGTVPSDAQVCAVGDVAEAFSGPGCSGTLAQFPVGVGGVSTCTSSTKIEILRSQLRNGSEDLLGVRGPFKIRSISGGGSTYNDYVEVTRTADTAKLQWTYIDGASDAISGLDIFTSNSHDFDSFGGMDGFDCNLVKIKVGAPVVSLSNTASSYTLTGVMATTQGALCPFRNVAGVKVYLNDGLNVHALSHGSGGGGPMAMLSLKSNSPNLTSGACTTMNVDLKDTSGNSYPASAPVSIQLIAMGASHYFYTDSGCAAGAATNVTVAIATGASTGIFYFKGSSSGVSQIYASAMGYGGTSNFFAVPSPSPYAGVKIAWQDDSIETTKNMLSGQCYGARLSPVDGFGSATVNATDILTTLTSTPIGANWTFHSDANCSSTALPSLTIPANLPLVAFWARPNLVVSNIAGSVAVSATAPSVTPFSDTYNISPAILDRYDVYSTSGVFFPGKCTEFVISAKNIAGIELHQLPADASVTVDAGTAEIATKSDCSDASTAAKTLTMSRYNPRTIVYARLPVGSMETTLTVNAKGSATTGTFGIPLAYPYIEINNTPERFYPFVADTCYPLTISLKEAPGGSPYPVSAGGQTVTLTPSAGVSTFHIYGDSACSSGDLLVNSTHSIDFAQGVNSKTVGVKIVSGALPTNVGFELSNLGPFPVSVYQPHAIPNFMLNGDACVVNQCKALTFGLSFSGVNPADTFDYVPSLSGASTIVYTDAACTALYTGGRLVVPFGGATPTLWYMTSVVSPMIEISMMDIKYRGVQPVHLSPPPFTAPTCSP